jgi:hypothetical protein
MRSTLYGGGVWWMKAPEFEKGKVEIAQYILQQQKSLQTSPKSKTGNWELPPSISPRHAEIILQDKLMSNPLRTLIIIEDVDTPELADKFRRSWLGDAFLQNANADVIVTSQRSMKGYPAVTIESFTETDAFNFLLAESGDVNISDADAKIVEKLSQICEGLPLALVLIGAAKKTRGYSWPDHGLNYYTTGKKLFLMTVHSLESGR